LLSGVINDYQVAGLGVETCFEIIN